MMAASQPWGHMAVWKEEPLVVTSRLLSVQGPCAGWHGVQSLRMVLTVSLRSWRTHLVDIAQISPRLRVVCAAARMPGAATEVVDVKTL